jgi:hypothetical protein
MKTKLNLLCTVLTLTLALNLNAASKAESAKSAAAPPKEQAKKSSAEFEQMKTLVGKWAGKADMGQGPVDMTLEYRLLAGGSVLEERCFAGTPQEMVTMYFDQKGKLAMTHYCVFGNRPAMKLKSWDGKTIQFDFDPSCGINVKKESHMHALSITFDNADTITSRCVAMLDGEEQTAHPTTLKRVKE